jgi:LPS export ABC transporter protein LptC
MKRTLITLLIVAAAGAGLWHVFGDRGGQAGGGTARQDVRPAYDFEAVDVQVRQMGADGRLQYELAARRFAQSAAGGEVMAEDLTIHHDPPGTIPGGPHRWTMTAAGAVLPAEQQAITLSGDVLARGLPRGDRTPVRFETDRLRYDITSQQMSTDAQVMVTWGRTRFTGRGFKANINDGTWELESGHGTIVP